MFIFIKNKKNLKDFNSLRCLIYFSLNIYIKNAHDMKETIIRLTEQELHKIVKESVNRVLNEIGNTKDGRNLIRKASDKRAVNDRKHLVRNVGDKKRKEYVDNDGMKHPSKGLMKVANSRKYLQDKGYDPYEME